MSPQPPKIYVFLEPQNVTLLRNRVFADIISYAQAIVDKSGG